MEPAKLESIALLEGLDPQAVAFIADRIQEVTVPAGGHIVKEGDFAYRFFAILEGKVVVRSGDQLLAELGPGQVFGEMSLADDLRRNADVIVTTAATLASLMAWDFRELLKTFPEFAERIDQLVANRS